MLWKRRVAQWRAAVEWMSVCASSEKVGDSFPLSHFVPELSDLVDRAAVDDGRG